MINRLLHIFLLLQIGIFVHAQDLRTAAIHLWNDQKVHIAGEDVWVDGVAGIAPNTAKTIVIRIINRNGTSIAETEVVPENNRFQGIVSLPETIISDYYFIDAYFKGIPSTTILCPIMVIHPTLPPNDCSFTENKNEHSTSSPIAIQLKKSNIPIRGPLEFSATGAESLSHISISAVLQDRLLELYESNTKGHHLVIDHTRIGEPNREGRMVNVVAYKNGVPAAGIKLIAAHKIPNSAIATSTTDASGKAQFILPLNYSDVDLIIEPASKNEKNITISPITLSLPQTTVGFPCLQLNERMKADIESRIFNSKVMKRFYGSGLRAIELSEADSSDFYGTPDALFFLDDYVRFPDMEEVIAEIIPQVRVKKNKDEVLLQVANQPLKMFFEDQALVLMDGLPITNTKTLLETDPLLIRSIEIVSRKYIQGTVEFNGIVHFKTYKGDMAGLAPDSEMRFTLKNIQEKTTYLPADHSSKKSRMPDLRNLLFLERDITSTQLANGVRFYASDAEGTYKIIVRGIDQSNQMVSSDAIITVKRPD